MKRQSVESSNLKSVGYDEFLLVLEIEFKGGAVYRYYGVPSEVHDELINAESVGKYFNANVKSKYNFLKVESC